MGNDVLITRNYLVIDISEFDVLLFINQHANTNIANIGLANLLANIYSGKSNKTQGTVEQSATAGAQ